MGRSERPAGHGPTPNRPSWPGIRVPCPTFEHAGASLCHAPTPSTAPRGNEPAPHSGGSGLRVPRPGRPGRPLRGRPAPEALPLPRGRRPHLARREQGSDHGRRRALGRGSSRAAHHRRSRALGHGRRWAPGRRGCVIIVALLVDVHVRIALILLPAKIGLLRLDFGDLLFWLDLRSRRGEGGGTWGRGTALTRDRRSHEGFPLPLAADGVARTAPRTRGIPGSPR